MPSSVSISVNCVFKPSPSALRVTAPPEYLTTSGAVLLPPCDKRNKSIRLNELILYLYHYPDIFLDGKEICSVCFKDGIPSHPCYRCRGFELPDVVACMELSFIFALAPRSSTERDCKRAYIAREQIEGINHKHLRYRARSGYRFFTVYGRIFKREPVLRAGKNLTDRALQKRGEELVDYFCVRQLFTTRAVLRLPPFGKRYRFPFISCGFRGRKLQVKVG